MTLGLTSPWESGELTGGHTHHDIVISPSPSSLAEQAHTCSYKFIVLMLVSSLESHPIFMALK